MEKTITTDEKLQLNPCFGFIVDIPPEYTDGIGVEIKVWPDPDSKTAMINFRDYDDGLRPEDKKRYVTKSYNLEVDKEDVVSLHAVFTALLKQFS